MDTARFVRPAHARVLFGHVLPKGFRSRRSRILLISAVIAAGFASPSSGSGSVRAAARLTPGVIDPPTVLLDVPATAMIGSNVAFTVSFDNNDPEFEVGYGPFVELRIPRTGADGAGAAIDDGLGTTAISALYGGNPVPARDFYRVTFNAGGNATHPIARNASGALINVTGTPGDELVVIRLPFGSFSYEQPPAVVTLNVNLSNLADLGTPLGITARGGYEFGFTPLDDWCCGDPASATLSAWTAPSTVTPTLLTLAKTYGGPADVSAETATGPNFTRQYTLAVDIAAGQTISNLQLIDPLPDNLEYAGLDDATPGYMIIDMPSTPGAQNPPDNDMVLEWASVTGGAGPTDASATFSFFVPRDDADGARVIDPATGTAVSSCNQAQTAGSWTPVDTRDSAQPVTVDPAGCEHTLIDRSLAVQKEIHNPSGSYYPGYVLDYRLEIQVSDFFAFDQIVLTDVLSDGQHFDPAFVPTLEVNGNGYSMLAADFAVANFTVDESEIDPFDGPPGVENPATDGTTLLTFRISDELDDRLLDPWLVGGCVDPAGGTPNPDCSVNDGATTAVIHFHAVIQENFTDTYPSGDWSVDQGDTFQDNALLIGRLLDTDTFAPGPNVTDDAAETLAIGPGALTKSIYAINGNTSFSLPARIQPGDAVTYRITYVMPTSDEENLEFIDYLPLPIFFVADPDANDYPAHSNGPAWTFDPVGQSGQPTVIPAPGHANFGPSDSFYDYTTPHLVPTLSADGANNRLNFYYGDYDDPRTTSTTVDLLFTVTVATEPFADSMYLTNQAHAIEGSTNAGEVPSDAIVQLILTEPVVAATKGVVWTSNPSNVFAPANRGPAGVTFLAPGSAPRWTGTITSNGLAARPINSNVRDVDAGDTVTFGITIENTGTSLKGAFDIRIRDTLQSQYQFPAGGLNLQLYYGDGTGPISYTGIAAPGDCTGSWPGDPCGPDGTADTADDLFGAGIELIDPPGAGVCSAHNPTLGNNVILITYDLEIRTGVAPGNIINTETLLSYAGEEGGPNHVPNPSPETDTATATISGAPVKYIVGTSQPSTGFTDMDELVIGETVRYRIVARIPESTSENFQFRDLLPGGLVFMDDGTARVGLISNAPITSLGRDDIPGIDSSCWQAGTAADATTPAALPCLLDDWNVGSSSSTTADPDVYNEGTDIYFKLGDLTNSDLDDDGEFVVVEFNARVHNLPGANQNDAGEILNNSVRAYAGATPVQVGSDSAAIPARVVESTLRIAKSVDDSHPLTGQVVTFTVVVDHAPASGATAFDVEISDTLPADLTLNPASVSYAASGGLTGVVNSSTGSLMFFSVTAFPIGGSLTITYQATVTAPFGTTVNNTALTTWSSLPGLDANERTGADGVGGALNDYAAQSSAPLNTDRDLVKALVADSHPSPVTALPEVAIGEILTYQLTLIIPSSSTDTYTVIDTLDSGLAFVDCETITAGASLTSSAVALNTAGNCSPGTVAGVSNPLVTNSGGTAAFDFGTITNSNSVNSETVVIRYRVVVLDTAPNVGGIELANSARMQWSTGAAVRQTSPVEIIESDLALEKSVDSPRATEGMVLTYSLRIFHSPASELPGYDAVINDTLPDYLTYVPGSLFFVTGSGVAPVLLEDTAIDPASGNLILHAEWDEIPLGQESTIEFQAVFGAAPWGTSVTNTASAEWTSLPGAVPAPPATFLSVFNQPYSHERRYDPLYPVDAYRVLAAATVAAPALPDTGFAPDRTTALPVQPVEKRYADLGDLRIQIPRLNQNLAVVGIPITESGWDLSWLWNQAGYLAGTAFPGTAGNSVITAHVYLSNGLPGPFVNLNTLRYGDRIILTMGGQRYMYEVRTNSSVLPTDLAPFRHEEKPWLTLITCLGYDPYLDLYRYRQVARAVLIEVR
jgi:LPXTG-site transpeptidase (sortase) family protein